MAERAAERLKITAKDLDRMKLIDQIIPEPNGGAHRDPASAIKNMKKRVEAFLEACMKKNFENPTSRESRAIQKDRLNKFRQMGDFAIGHLNAKGEKK